MLDSLKNHHIDRLIHKLLIQELQSFRLCVSINFGQPFTGVFRGDLNSMKSATKLLEQFQFAKNKTPAICVLEHLQSIDSLLII